MSQTEDLPWIREKTQRASDDVSDLIERAIHELLSGDFRTAESFLRAIDRDELVKEREAALLYVAARRPYFTQKESSGTKSVRKAVTTSVADGVFTRDCYICRYAHCRKRTIDLRVLKLLSRAFPDALPYRNRNWKPVIDHIVYWTCSASIEHAVSIRNGGTSNPNNLLTACYQCNDVKNMYRAENLGWVVIESDASEWSGLTSHLPDLKMALASYLKIEVPTRETTVMTEEGNTRSVFKEGNLIKAVLPGKEQPRSYRVGIVDGTRAVIYEMWRNNKTGAWEQGRPNIVDKTDLGVIAVVMERAPSQGAPITSPN